MLRDGTYRDAIELKPNDSMMPFYRKNFSGKRKEGDNFKGYENIFTMNKDAHKGWQSEHRFIAEWAHPDAVNKEIVHHRDFNPRNNSPDNLRFMSEVDHVEFHRHIARDRSPETCEKLSVAQSA